MRKTSQRGRAQAVADDTPSSAFAWRKDIVAAVLVAAAAVAVIVNAAFMQAGPHPAPLFSARPVAAPAPAPKSIRVVGQELTGPPLPIPAPKSRPVEIEAPKAEIPLPVRPRAETIADIQRELTRRGFYDGAADGVHGPKTDAAMRDFEQASGLKPGSEPNEIFLRAITRSTAKAGPQLATAPARAADPIAELIAPSSKRILAVQRALADYGFGQIKPNGTLGPETKDAIERFERARKMPVTGQISPRLLRELSALTGRPLE